MEETGIRRGYPDNSSVFTTVILEAYMGNAMASEQDAVHGCSKGLPLTAFGDVMKLFRRASYRMNSAVILHHCKQYA
jgi:hypothetical protein